MTQTEPASRSGLTPLSARAKATRGMTRLNNLRLALQIVYREAPTSRADVARISRLTPATASGLVDELLEMGLVEEIGPGPSAGGKPPTLIAPNPKGRSIVALDLSSADFKGSVVDLAGEIQVTESVPAASGDRGLAAVRRLVGRLVDRCPAPLLGVGVGTPGAVDPDRGLVTSANLDWQEAALAEYVVDDAQTPVHILNDAHAAALHEYSVHAPRVSSLALARVGRGVGTGYVLDGHLYRGEGTATGEIGHVRIDEGGKPCTCGNTGCLETVASLSALLEAIGGDQDVTPERMAQISEDPAHRQAIQEAAVALSRALAPLVALLAVHEIVLWGEVTSLGEVYRERVEAEVRSRVLPVDTEQIQVRYATAGPDAVIRGAAAMVLSAELGVVW